MQISHKEHIEMGEDTKEARTLEQEWTLQNIKSISK